MVADPVERRHHLGEESARFLQDRPHSVGIDIVMAVEFGDLIHTGDIGEGEHHVVDLRLVAGHAEKGTEHLYLWPTSSCVITVPWRTS